MAEASQSVVDIAGIVGQIGQSVNASITDLVNSMPGGGQSEALTKQGSELQAEGQREVNEANVRAAVKMKMDNAAVAAAFGFMTPRGQSISAAELSEKIAIEEKDLDERRSMILAKQEASFFDNPISWISNQISLPFDIAAFNNVNAGQEHHLAVLHRLASFTEEQIKINAAVDTAAGAGMLDGMNKMATAKALEQQAASSLAVAQLGVHANSVRLAATEDMFRNSIATNELKVKAVEISLREKGLSMEEEKLSLEKVHSTLEQNAALRAEESHKLEIIQRQLTLGNEQERVAAKLDLNKRLLIAAQVFKLDPINVDQLQLLGSGPQKAFWEQAISDPNIQSGRLGFDAASALDVANKLNMPLTPGINIVREKLITWQQNAIANEGGGITWKALGPEVQHFKVQKLIADNAVSEMKNIPNEGGIFSPPSLVKVLQIGTGDAALANTKIGAALAPLAARTPNYATKADDILAVAADLIAKGEASPAQMAAEINKIYTAILVDNNDVRQYSLLGLKAPTAGVEGFKTSIQLGNAFGSKAIVNMTSPAAVEGILTRLLTNRQITETIGFMQGTP